ncbi:TBC domain protein, partial [Ancylostoma duodenale]
DRETDRTADTLSGVRETDAAPPLRLIAEHLLGGCTGSSATHPVSGGHLHRNCISSKVSIMRYDPCSPEERKKSLQYLLAHIYHENSMQNSTRDLTDSLTESFHSDVSMASPKRHTTESLMALDYVTDESQLREEIADLKRKVEQANHRLVRVVRQRAFYRAKQNTKCAVLSAILMAISPKTSADSKLRFSLEPPTIHDGVEEWKRAMRIMARLPGGIPNIFRNKLWSTLGELHVLSAGLDWEQICRSAFSEHVQPEDIEIHSQILKDLHRTGWSEFDDEKKLKQVLLAYARYNKEIGYCQGFNVIAALILQVVDYRTDIALKVMIFLIEHVLPRGYFDQSLKALSVDMTVMKDLMLQRVPNTIEHLEHLKNTSADSEVPSIPGNEYEPPLPNIFSMHWFLTLFATCLPRDCVLRLWDVLMLQGSEVLLRTAIALWSKMSRKILRTSTADEFYSLMGKLCKELAEMNEEEQDHLMTVRAPTTFHGGYAKVVYTMAEFPYPGLAELREKYTWNIHPLSATFKLFRKSVTDILYDDSSDGEPSCSPCESDRRDVVSDIPRSG